MRWHPMFNDCHSSCSGGSLQKVAGSETGQIDPLCERSVKQQASQAVADRAGVKTRMTNIGNVAWKKRPCLAPIGSVIVEHLSGSNLTLCGHTSAHAPFRIIVNTMGRIGDH